MLHTAAFNRRARRALALAAALALCLLPGCQDTAQDTRYPLEAAGHTFSQSPARVVTLSPAATEWLTVLGYGGRLVGVSDFCAALPGAGALPACGDSLAPDVEEILALEAQAVFTTAPLPAQSEARLEQAGVAVVILPRVESIEEMGQQLHTVCAIFSGTALADRRLEEFSYYCQVTFDYWQQQAAVLGEENSAIYLVRPPFTMATGETMEGTLLMQMGLANAAAEESGWNYPEEKEPDLLPDIIFYGEETTQQSLLDSPYYNQTPAVLNGRLVELDSALLARQSPAMLPAWEEALAAALPGGFSQPKPSVLLPLPEPEPEPAKNSWWPF